MNLNDQQLSVLKRRKYLEYLKILPTLREQKTRTYISLVFTFVAIAIFGLFAINPTLSTISQLRKQVEDYTRIKDQLTTKSANLSRLDAQYQTLQSNFSLLLNVIPKKPNAPFLLGQLQTLAQKEQVTITNLQSLQVDLAKPVSRGQESSYVFSVEAEGNYQQLLQFAQDLTTFNRLITFEKLTLASVFSSGHARTVKLSIRARAYFKT